MSLLVKICGLKTPEALDVALESGADLVGFVFFAPSPRNLALAVARDLGARVKGRAGKVALSVDADDATLAAVVEALKPDMLQLHGVETPERVTALRARFGLPVMKAVPIAERKDLARIDLYKNVADRLIFDARAPQDATQAGRARHAVRLDLAQGRRSGNSLHAVGRPRRRQCRGGLARHPRARASMCPLASSARPAKKTRTRSAPSSAPRAPPRPR